MKDLPPDGVHALVPRDRMCPAARKLRDAYSRVPGAALYRREFGWYVMDRWKREGHVKPDTDLAKLFNFDPPGKHDLYELGWCEAAFVPAFEEKVVERRGEHEVVQDFAGRKLLCFAGRRSGFMPEYIDHPVKDMRTWEDDVKWRLDPATASRFDGLDARMAEARADAARPLGSTMVCHCCEGLSRLPRSMWRSVCQGLRLTLTPASARAFRQGREWSTHCLRRSSVSWPSFCSSA